MNKTNIALFSFPDKEKEPAVKSWCSKIHRFRRKGGKDEFKITKISSYILNLMKLKQHKTLRQKFDKN